MTDQDDRPDPGLLAAARAALGTGGTRDTLEEALARAVRQARRDRAVEAELARLTRSGPGVGGGPEARGRPGGPGGPVAPGGPAGPVAPDDPAGRRPPGGAPAPGLPPGWLLDGSARRAAAHDPAVAAGLGALLHGGLLVTCPVLDLIALADDDRGDEDGGDGVARQRRLAYRCVPMTPASGERAVELHRVLVRAGHPRAADAAALLVAATALEHGLGVLHRHPGLALLGRLAGLCERSVRPLEEPLERAS